METSIVVSLLIIGALVLRYLAPLMLHRLKTRKVRVVVIDQLGCKKTNVLYLYPDDPLWEVLKAHKEDKHA